MNQEVTKAIITRTPLLDEDMRNISAGNLFAYNRQRNLLVKLLRKSKKKDFYNTLNVKRIRLSNKILLTRLSKMRE